MPIDLHRHWSGLGAELTRDDYAAGTLLPLDDTLAAALALREHHALAALSQAQRIEAVSALAAGYVVWADEASGDYGAETWGPADV